MALPWVSKFIDKAGFVVLVSAKPGHHPAFFVPGTPLPSFPAPPASAFLVVLSQAMSNNGAGR